jgi:fatty acyl-CoA reductase
MTKIQRKIYEANLALQYFVMNDWKFKNKNFIELNNVLRSDDLKAFGYEDCFTFDVIYFMTICISGVKKYLLLDDEKNENFARLKFKILKVISSIIKSMFYVLAFYTIFIKFNVIELIRNF